MWESNKFQFSLLERLLKDVRTTFEVSPWRSDVHIYIASGLGLRFSSVCDIWGGQRCHCFGALGKVRSCSSFWCICHLLMIFEYQWLFLSMEQVDLSDISEFVANRSSVSTWTRSRRWMESNYWPPQMPFFTPFWSVVNHSYRPCILIERSFHQT